METFWGELVTKGYRDNMTLEFLALTPSTDNKGRDHDKRLCVYWKMLTCDFWFALSSFERKLLKKLDVAHAQMTSTSWCTVISFEAIFHEFSDQLDGAKLTIPIFAHFFTIVVVNDDYLAMNKRLKNDQIFDIVGDFRISRIDT